MTSVLAHDLGLEGKVAIVTGGGAAGDGIGNGRAAAILLARAGARVLVVDRRLDLARRTVEMIVEEGGDAAACAADVTEDAQCRAMVETALTQFGRLDLLDNNVGIASKGSVVDEDPQLWRRVMQVNVDSMFLASKHAMAVDHGPQGIRVNCVAPGPVYTPMVAAEGMSPAARERRRQASVLGMEGTGWDVGYAVRFLLSNHARFITGQTLVVDGGATLVGRPRATDSQ